MTEPFYLPLTGEGDFEFSSEMLDVDRFLPNRG